MPYVRRPYDSSFGGCCTCEYEGADCPYCRGWEDVWEEPPKPYVKHPKSKCLFLINDWGLETILKMNPNSTSYPEFIYYRGDVFKKTINNHYKEFIPSDPYEYEGKEVDEAI